MHISGGCSCGQARFSADADPTFIAVCHCRACQKAGGSAFAVIVALPAEALKITGDVTTYDTTGDSGKGVHYRFCPTCGSPVASNVDVFPDMMMIRSGTLDDPSWVKPAMEIYCDSKQPWIALGNEMKSFTKMPG
jgi:hypothetical protein